MRGPTSEEILNTNPPELRISSATTQAYLDMRRKILKGEYQPGRQLTPKEIQDTYKINNNGVQILLYRLAIEGLIKVMPVRERNWRNNAALNEYHIADLNVHHRIFSNRQGNFVGDVAKPDIYDQKQTLELKVCYADEEIASLLEIKPQEKVIFHRNLQCRETVPIAISDLYIGFWFAEMLPELEKPDSDIYALMRELGRKPFWCTEIVDIVHATSKEREIFELSPDDPTPMIKILRRSYVEDGTPLDIQYLTDRADMYRLHYSFPLFADEVPVEVREQ
jgi:DNA-binding GntR family transcriptional regulator